MEGSVGLRARRRSGGMRSKNKTANSTTVIIKLYTTTVILQLLFWRAPDSITFSFLKLYKIFKESF